MNNNKKSALTADEQDILDMADRIRRNMKDDEYFSKALDRYIRNRGKTTEALKLGSTPNSIVAAGADSNLNLVISPDTITKCMSKKEEVFHGHDLSADIIKLIPAQLRNPVMIFEGRWKNTLVIISELTDIENRKIMTAIKINSSEQHHKVNKICSIYGRTNMEQYLKLQLEKGGLIAANIEKANKMLQSAGLQLPLEETFISFNDSISYSMQSVKGFEEFFRRKEFANNFERRLDEIDALKERLCRVSVKAVKEHPDYICYITDLHKLPAEEKQAAVSLLSQREDLLCNELIESGRRIEKSESHTPACITPELVNMYTDFMALENKVELIRQEKNILNFGKASPHRKNFKR
ncbi:hypothetical protein [Ruminococcus sp. Marseille-P6503]|uniref:MuF-C-terminal domain-containing protein n=1 Tax=Ruminococcus sp. Marseille-P6503 TaxID=2364796 RepID=UPI000F5213BF|nr:hypothetical protein [Ruminococcus sp. Marseille-P6503]